jgi:hypothetical protein
MQIIVCHKETIFTLRVLESEFFEFSAQLQIYDIFNDVTICWVHEMTEIMISV